MFKSIIHFTICTVLSFISWSLFFGFLYFIILEISIFPNIYLFITMMSLISILSGYYFYNFSKEKLLTIKQNI